MANHKSGAERRNDKMESIFNTAYELAARNAGWSPTGPHGKWVCAGDKHFAKGSYMPTPRACRYICDDHNLLGLRSS
jgi:hypothetical protein